VVTPPWIHISSETPSKVDQISRVDACPRNFQQLRQPVVVKGVDYTYEITLKVERSVGFVLRGELAPEKILTGSFSPAYIVREVSR
jgi:hypothetical protein